MNNTKAILAVLLVFIFGAASGALVTHMIDKSRFESFSKSSRPPREETLVKRLTDKLDLDSRQEEQVRAIVQETHRAMKQIRQQSRPQIERVLEDGQKRISVLLTPEQREKFEKIIAERKARHHGDGQGDGRDMPGRGRE